MVVPLLSPSGSLLLDGTYVAPLAVTLVTVKVVLIFDLLRLPVVTLHVPPAVLHEALPEKPPLQVPLTVAPDTSAEFASRTVIVTDAVHVFLDVAVLPSRSATCSCGVAGAAGVVVVAVFE